MTVEFRLPDLGEGITEVEIMQWLVKPGDHVVLDQEVVSVQSDKAVVELPSPVAGTVLELHGAVGQIVPVSSVLLTLREGDDSQPASVSQNAEDTAPVATAVASNGGFADEKKHDTVASNGMWQAQHTMTTSNGTRQTRDTFLSRRALATPVARRMAHEFGLDIQTIKGSGPSGRVRTEDVQKIIAAMTPGKPGKSETLDASPDRVVQPVRTTSDSGVQSPPVPATQGAGMPARQSAMPTIDEGGDEERIPLRGLRRRIAENMVLSVSTIPQVSSMVEVDASGLVALRAAVLADASSQGLKLSYLPFIVKALVQTLRLYPSINAAIDNERQEIVIKHRYHIGIATATPDGLLVPVLCNADQLTINELAAEINRVAEQGRERKLQAQELRGSTFTISNFGAVGGFFATPIINPGEAGILGLGRITKRPWVVGDQLEVRPVLPLSLTVDHRLIDGELAMRFLNSLIGLLEHPQRLMMQMR